MLPTKNKDKAVHTNSLWASSSLEAEITAPSLTGECSADVVVVGGGYTGLRAALELAQSGVKTVVLEAAKFGWGASGRNGGQVNPLLPVHSPTDVARLLPPRDAQRIMETALSSADELFTLVQHWQINCQAERCGWMRTAHYAGAAGLLKRQCEQWRRIGADIEIMEGASLVAATGTDIYQTGALMPGGGRVQPLAYCRGLARVAMAAGAMLHAESQALAIVPDGDDWLIRTSCGAVRARRVVLCTNGYADKILWPKIAASFLPLISIQASTYPLETKEAQKILPSGFTIADTRRLIFYARREVDGRVVCGTIADNEMSLGNFHRLQSLAASIFPVLRRARWEFCWGGRIAVTHNYLPHIQELAPRLWTGFGYNGRGVAMATVMGRALAECILEKTECALPIRPLRHHPWRHFFALGMSPAIRWMEWRDKMESAGTKH